MNKNKLIQKLLVFFPFVLGLLEIIIFKKELSTLKEINENLKLSNFILLIGASLYLIVLGTWNYLYQINFKNEVIKSLYVLSIFLSVILLPLILAFENLLLAIIDVLLLIIIHCYFLAISLKKKNIIYLVIINILVLLFTNYILIKLILS